VTVLLLTIFGWFLNLYALHHYNEAILQNEQAIHDIDEDYKRSFIRYSRLNTTDQEKNAHLLTEKGRVRDAAPSVLAISPMEYLDYIKALVPYVVFFTLDPMRKRDVPVVPDVRRPRHVREGIDFDRKIDFVSGGIELDNKNHDTTEVAMAKLAIRDDPLKVKTAYKHFATVEEKYIPAPARMLASTSKVKLPHEKDKEEEGFSKSLDEITGDDLNKLFLEATQEAKHKTRNSKRSIANTTAAVSQQAQRRQYTCYNDGDIVIAFQRGAYTVTQLQKGDGFDYDNSAETVIFSHDENGNAVLRYSEEDQLDDLFDGYAVLIARRYGLSEKDHKDIDDQIDELYRKRHPEREPRQGEGRCATDSHETRLSKLEDKTDFIIRELKKINSTSTQIVESKDTTTVGNKPPPAPFVRTCSDDQLIDKIINKLKPLLPGKSNMIPMEDFLREAEGIQENPIVKIPPQIQARRADDSLIYNACKIGQFIVTNEHLSDDIHHYIIPNKDLAAPATSVLKLDCKKTRFARDLVAHLQQITGYKGIPIDKWRIPVVGEQVTVVDIVNNITCTGNIVSIAGDAAKINLSTTFGSCGAIYVANSDGKYVGIHTNDGFMTPYSDQWALFFRNPLPPKPKKTQIANVSVEQQKTDTPATTSATKKFAITGAGGLCAAN